MHPLRFTGRAALVTGAASGIGVAIAERLAAEGASVGLIDSRAEPLGRQLARLQEAGARAYAESADVSDGDSIAHAVSALVNSLGRLDVLVHAAGIVGPTGLNCTDYPIGDFRRVIDVNLTGAFLTCRAAIPPMLQGGYGRILLIASMAGKDGNPGMAGYVASKAGLIGLAKALGKEYATTGITVNALAPAVIATPMNADTHPDTIRALAEKIPMRRLGTVAEAAAIGCWICSAEASFNTGAVFDLSGGRATH